MSLGVGANSNQASGLVACAGGRFKPYGILIIFSGEKALGYRLTRVTTVADFH